MPIYEAPDGAALAEDEESDSGNDEIPVDSTFRPTYNFAPGYQGIVCRAVTHDDKKQEQDSMQKEHAGNDVVCLHDVPSQLCYKLQVMKWGLVPSWSKQRPAYSSIRKTINCRSDSLARGGMWASMRGRKRCVVVAQGFFEWLKAGPKERVPYYIRRHDSLPLLFAGLWDCLTTGGTDGSPKKKTHTYTIITTDSSKQMQFLHDRMPVIFDLNLPALRTWLDPSRTEWSEELHSLLRPWPYSVGGASLDIDAVSKDVNKVGHSSPTYVVPVASSANKSNIANFFSPNDDKQKPETRADTAVIATTVPTKRKFSSLPVVDGLREETRFQWQWILTSRHIRGEKRGRQAAERQHRSAAKRLRLSSGANPLNDVGDVGGGML